MISDELSSKKTSRHSNTQAVILAAGLGSRLGAVCEKTPKCLMDVGGQTLLRHHLNVLGELGVERVLVVAGHGAEKTMAEVNHAGVMQFNSKYASTNSLYSLWLARKWIAGSFILINGDVLADPQIYRNVLEEKGNVLAFDSKSGREEEEMKVQFEEGRLQAISKEMGAEKSHGENLGILKFDPQGARALLEEANRLVGKGRVNDWATAAVHSVAQQIAIKGVDVAELPWTEIDFPADLEHARKRVWPKIARRNPSPSNAQATASDVLPQASFFNLTKQA